MTGVQTFPTPFIAHSISEVKDLIDKYSKYGIKVGFSDHIKGGTEESFILPIMALSAGASAIEKHFTTDRKFKQTDYHSSLNKDELKKFIISISKYKQILNPVRDFNKWEKSYRNMFKKSPVVSKNKIKGEKIKPSEIIYLKNSSNLQSLNINQICNKKIINNVISELQYL